MGGDIRHHSGRKLEVGRRRIDIPSTDDPDSRIQHHVNAIGIQLGYDQGWSPVEGLLRERKKENKGGQRNSS